MATALATYIHVEAAACEWEQVSNREWEHIYSFLLYYYVYTEQNEHDCQIVHELHMTPLQNYQPEMNSFLSIFSLSSRIFSSSLSCSFSRSLFSATFIPFHFPYWPTFPLSPFVSATAHFRSISNKAD